MYKLQCNLSIKTTHDVIVYMNLQWNLSIKTTHNEIVYMHLNWNLSTNSIRVHSCHSEYIILFEYKLHKPPVTFGGDDF